MKYLFVYFIQLNEMSFRKSRMDLIGVDSLSIATAVLLQDITLH
ncbi:hypothetical protein [Aliivibrio fischeri]|nr:hypothetical protein [Aliivibrio fischeri]